MENDNAMSSAVSAEYDKKEIVGLAECLLLLWLSGETSAVQYDTRWCIYARKGQLHLAHGNKKREKNKEETKTSYRFLSF